MGSAASIPARLTKSEARAVLGPLFDEKLFDDAAKKSRLFITVQMDGGKGGKGGKGGSSGDVQGDEDAGPEGGGLRDGRANADDELGLGLGLGGGFRGGGAGSENVGRGKGFGRTRRERQVERRQLAEEFSFRESLPAEGTYRGDCWLGRVRGHLVYDGKIYACSCTTRP